MNLRANGIEFAALADGPEDGPLVLLLHGFPELSRSWRHQLPALAGAGFRAVAPDLRGYGDTEARGPYDLRTLAADVDGLIDALGHERAVVVGHDWGGVIAWAAAHIHRDRVARLAILNAPHPRLMSEELFASGEQRKRSMLRLPVPGPALPRAPALPRPRCGDRPGAARRFARAQRVARRRARALP